MTNLSKRSIVRLLLIMIGMIVLAGMIGALATANTVPSTGAGQSSMTIMANDIKPGECGGITLYNVITGPDGTDSNDLMLGTSGADTHYGFDGDDCMVGGDGDDVLDPGPGDNVVLGGAGYDYCVDHGGTNTFYGCEEIATP